MVIEDSLLVPGSGAVDFAVRQLLTEIVFRTRRVLGNHLEAIVLGGSLARHQGMAWSSIDGECLLSDIDLYVVRSQARSATEAELGRELRELVLDDPSIRPPLDLAFVTGDQIRAAAHTLHMQQLLEGHQILYSARGVDPSDWFVEAPVSLEEAQRLLLNRLCEAVRVRGGEDMARHGQALKLLIDAPLALLASCGRYCARRSDQRAELRRANSTCSEAARTGLEDGLGLGEAWRRAAIDGALTTEEWAEWGERAIAVTPRFVRAMLLASLSVSPDPGPTLAERWEAAWSDAARGEALEPVLGRWRRRGGWLASLRRARQWAPLAPCDITPWWRHGGGGSGADRLYAAGAALWATTPGWSRHLRGLTSDPPTAIDAESDAWLGQLWSDWILGRGRR